MSHHSDQTGKKLEHGFLVLPWTVHKIVGTLIKDMYDLGNIREDLKVNGADGTDLVSSHFVISQLGLQGSLGHIGAKETTIKDLLMETIERGGVVDYYNRRPSGDDYPKI